MTRNARFEIVAYPKGARRVVGVIHAPTTHAPIAHAQVQATMREEYVDVEADGDVIAIVGAEGVI